MDNTAPVSGAQVTVDDSGGQAVSSGITDNDGKVTFHLVQGQYEINVITCPGAISLPPPRDVTVANGSFNSVRMECDTGIR